MLESYTTKREVLEFMPFPIPTDWQYDSPEAFVVGDGSYAKALAFVFGAVCLSIETLKTGAESFEVNGCPLVLKNLKRVFIAVSSSMPASDVLVCHRMAWTWVEKLSPLGDQHDLVFVFVLPPVVSAHYEADLALGLGIQDIDPKAMGLAFWRSSGSLCELLEVLGQIRPTDLPPLLARQTADARYVALAHLGVAVRSDNLESVRRAAQNVLSVFLEHEYQLDLFCTSPCHRNGNSLRQWLHGIVTDSVTPELLETGRKCFADWLALDSHGNT